MSADELATIKETLHRIEKAIVGDREMGQRGIVVRLDELEKHIAEHDKKMVLWGGIITGCVFALTHLKDKFFK
jgi:hypothetical protein